MWNNFVVQDPFPVIKSFQFQLLPWTIIPRWWSIHFSSGHPVQMDKIQIKLKWRIFIFPVSPKGCLCSSSSAEKRPVMGQMDTHKYTFQLAATFLLLLLRPPSNKNRSKRAFLVGINCPGGERKKREEDESEEKFTDSSLSGSLASRQKRNSSGYWDVTLWVCPAEIWLMVMEMAGQTPQIPLLKIEK